MLVQALETAGIAFFAVPNEGKHSPATHNYLNSMGRRAGVPDIILVDTAPMDGRPIAIEMKAKDGSVTTAQRRMIVLMDAAGWHVRVAFGYEQAIQFLEEMGFSF